MASFEILKSTIIKAVLIALALAIFGFFPLLGIPGAIVFSQWHYFFNLLNLGYLLPEPQGDSAWPFFLLMTMFWPWCIPIGTAIASTSVSTSRKRLVLSLVLTYLILFLSL